MPGDLTHYDHHGDCVGYSRRMPLGRTQHYNKSGEKTGHSQRILWILAFHHHSDPQENE